MGNTGCVLSETLTWVQVGQDIPYAFLSLPWMGQRYFLPSHSSWTHISNWNRKQGENKWRELMINLPTIKKAMAFIRNLTAVINTLFWLMCMYNSQWKGTYNFFFVTVLKLSKCKGKQLKNKQAYLNGPTLWTGVVFQQHPELYTICQSLLPASSFRSALALCGNYRCHKGLLPDSVWGWPMSSLCCYHSSMKNSPGKRQCLATKLNVSKSDQGTLTPLSLAGHWAMSLKQRIFLPPWHLPGVSSCISCSLLPPQGPLSWQLPPWAVAFSHILPPLTLPPSLSWF